MWCGSSFVAVVFVRTTRRPFLSLGIQRFVSHVIPDSYEFSESFSTSTFLGELATDLLRRRCESNATTQHPTTNKTHDLSSFSEAFL
jgi:hypothetical protein